MKHEDKKIEHCPFCGNVPILEEYYETCDGRGEEPPKIICECGVEMELTRAEFKHAEEVCNFKGGYVSSNKRFWNMIHQLLIDKWNKRIMHGGNHDEY